MNDEIKQRFSEYINDIEKLKQSPDRTRNTFWANQVARFLQELTLSPSDMSDFYQIKDNLRYATSTMDTDLAKFENMKMLLELLSRKNLDYRESSTINPLPKIEPIKINQTKRIQSDKGYPSQVVATTQNKPRTDKIFIVHGHDGESKLELKDMLEGMSLQPIILHKQANKGKTLIEKFEEHSGEVDFAFVLLTPDDIGGNDEKNLKKRARQNVILELGYFIGKLGRGRVCCLYKEGVELPSDMDGILYVKFKDSPEDSYLKIKQELEAAGYHPK